MTTFLDRLRRRVEDDGPERYREHGPHGGGSCVDPSACDFTEDWWCPGCERWRCWCRGSDREGPRFLSRLCDKCWFAALQDGQRALLRLLALHAEARRAHA